jgi:hypothetical protein
MLSNTLFERRYEINNVLRMSAIPKSNHRPSAQTKTREKPNSIQTTLIKSLPTGKSTNTRVFSTLHWLSSGIP